MLGLIAARGGVRSVVWLAAALLLVPVARAAGVPAPGVGAYAPPIALSDLGGALHQVSWGDGAPGATVVFFFDPETSASLLEMSFLDSLYQRARDFGLAVYAVESKGRQPAEVGRSLERYFSVYRAPAFPVLPDPSFRAGRTYGVQTAPVTFVAESHGVILNRIDGYDHRTAVAVARRVEQLLLRERGFFSPVLREVGISETEEIEAEDRIAAAVAAGSRAPASRALGQGDRVPDFEYTDVNGRTGRWSWSADAAGGPRIVIFFGGLSLASIEELTWLDGLARRGRDAGLEVLAVEASGQDRAALLATLEKYRRYNPDPSFPVVSDVDAGLARIFGPWEQLPQTYLVDADGRVLYRAEGFSAGEGEIMAGKTERAYLLKGRPFPAVGSDGSAPAPSPVEDEAPSVQRRLEQDDRHRSSLVQGDAAFMAWDFDKALTSYLAALEVQPRDLHALVRAAQIYDRRGELGLALEYWARVLTVRPDHAEAASRVRELRTR